MSGDEPGGFEPSVDRYLEQIHAEDRERAASVLASMVDAPGDVPAEGVTIEFTPDGVEAIADIAFEVNRTTQNIGARRLHTIIERVVEDPRLAGLAPGGWACAA